jgi:glycine/D-amino acid oxidase-like deaminating enzyme
MLNEREARELSGARRCAGALLDESAGMLHPLDYCYGLASAAMAAGAAVHEDAGVTDVRPADGGWQVHVSGQTVAARSVLLCTNACSTGVARRLFRTIVPLTVYQIATAPLSADAASRVAPKRHPVADTRANLFTYRLDAENRLISGGMAIVPVAAENRMQRVIAGRLARELGLDAAPKVEHVWRGTAAMTTDFLPHVYRFGPGFYGGIGCNGRGIPMTAMLGEVLADAADGADPETLPVPLASTRGLPFHALARAAPSAAVAQARLEDWRTGL